MNALKNFDKIAPYLAIEGYPMSYSREFEKDDMDEIMDAIKNI